MERKDGERLQAQEKSITELQIPRSKAGTLRRTALMMHGGLGRLATITVKKNLAELKPILEDQITF